ncbi:Eco57I restriction-modification methylase domain-containing protein [Bacteroides thetaiotaomicron]|jgi:eco57I restriction endonuclease|uniref:Eco57I restriction-modification methylase domain-containing protein n=3 Tax=Bacteroides TaxID=816 RepID=A0AAW4Z4H7_BACT4|nr:MULTISPECIES: Eco57I restriction-modification methylase domain-containing protein [Bacteroides]MCE9236026.1 Eco57I restriction-modification methylase domain-containing protein [Bacteroides thetaiotaomicron]MCE9268462.1 Eco57I restriction-modification methylase domain-containing protein [Bacteroides thetaiotaomicron]MCE9277972.1 Eco57I restriction-modification methylase domain-containing protein [Bacteroides thetaiotaomicron]MCE9292233.1 Eco57I restriction-modification methylase domain-contai
MKFTSSLKLKLIYVFRINDAAHRGCLKVGEATCDNDNVFGLAPNSKALNESAKKRINQYTQTAGIAYDLLYTELTIYNSRKGLCSFNDKEVHSVLERSGIRKKIFDTENRANEWFITDLETVKRAIVAVKEGRESLSSAEVSHDQTPIVFRPEQQEAIEKTKKQFKKSNQMLWNAKMRFGKTLSALQVVKDMDFSRTLILTHRPVVDSGWFEDFGKIFYDSPDFAYGSKNNGDSHASLEVRAKQGKCRYVYFASMQDLRGSELVGGNFDKNNEVFATAWDCIIVDEAHEGTQTELGKAVMQELTKANTKILRLSGTPFNLLDDFKEDEIYTWDYVMEQRAKASWDLTHFGDPNPYASLPTMNIYTYDLGRLLHEFVDEDVAFNFREFFRVNEAGNFIHEKDVKAFLSLISKEDKDSCYPFANEEYRNIFRHTLWMLPGVKEARAMSALLQSHPVFQHFKVVNVAGDGDEDEESKDALAAVEEAIGKDPDATRTITLSCGRLTTGVSVKAWTGVFMLSGSYNTAASSYMQTIFRVQTPATINGRVKEQCYVFDFAPDRTLKVIAETAKISSKAGKTSGNDRKIMGEFLNFCPIISIEGSKMSQFDVPKMLEQLKRVYVERVVRNGFEDKSLYNDELMKLNDLELQEFDDLKKIIGQTKAMPKTNQVDINNQGLTDEQYEELEDLEKKSKKRGKDKQPLTEEEKKRLEELKKKKNNREAAISILRGISIRMPLLIYGAELSDESQDITIDNFASLIDPQSWEEFMPKGVTKQKFNSIKKYYDPEIFCAAGKRIRAMARAADKLSVEERIERITDIFSTFRNPDKETVLTPWRVVNMHLGDCLGGYNFFEKGYETTLSEPRFIDRGEVTANVFAPDSHILEINSKSGLYPLYMAYSIYRTRLKDSLFSVSSIEDEQRIWDKVVAENIFVICKTPMAKSITKRTLIGFRKAKVNTRYFEDLINQIKNKPEHFIKQVDKFITDRTGIKNMKINAIVGNPPYQIMDGGAGVSAKPVYNLFVEIAKQIAPNYISMIMPSRWFAGGKGLDSFRESMLSDKRISHIFDYVNAKDCFPTASIGGGVNYILWDVNYKGNCSITTIQGTQRDMEQRPLNQFSVFIRYNSAIHIVHKCQSDNSFASIVNSRNPFGLSSNIRGEKTGEIRLITSAGTSWLSKSVIAPTNQLLSKYKILMSKVTAEHAGEPDKKGQFKIISRTEIIGPNDVCTDSYLIVGASESKLVVENEYKYIQTRFFRFLLMLSVSSINLSSEKFQFIPLQDFTSNSDINWSRSISEIDTQLYAKYGLSEDEISFIESMIKPM